jgi:hypothetical protein
MQICTCANEDADNVDLNQLTPNRDILKLKELLNYNLHICQLAYLQIIVEDIGVEPMTLCVQGRCSSQLS